ncbi:hypothetical protein C0Q70_04725 [Pomacea canaliculata]|uniref:Uncharacterized protein n=1 Tax=Pomacea canaliculata TaxID=400727 RepID=A0A2T7PJ77_POMCA|nr:hypothetical protein C0Q70_04725 [Pomacea canaliculata]
MSHLTFQIVFAATRRESFNSDIALDDIRVFNCTDPELQGEAFVLFRSANKNTVAVHHQKTKDDNISNNADYYNETNYINDQNNDYNHHRDDHNNDDRGA